MNKGKSKTVSDLRLRIALLQLFKIVNDRYKLYRRFKIFMIVLKYDVVIALFDGRKASITRSIWFSFFFFLK